MYGKTFTSLWEGSMVGKSDAQLVFIFLFCHCDQGGFVEAHPAVIAVKTGLPIERVDAAIQYLEAPDDRSRSKAEGGRRIIPLNGDHVIGWKIVNYRHYRGLRRADDRRVYHRKYWHLRKARKAAQTGSTTLNPTQPIAEAEAEAEAERLVEARKRSTRISSSESLSPLVGGCEKPDQQELLKDQDPPAFDFPVTGRDAKAGPFVLTQAQVRELAILYPAADVEAELRKAKGWLIANPERLKTRKGTPAFIHRWLGKAQDAGRGKTFYTSPGSASGGPEIVAPGAPQAETPLRKARKQREEFERVGKDEPMPAVDPDTPFGRALAVHRGEAQEPGP